MIEHSTNSFLEINDPQIIIESIKFRVEESQAITGVHIKSQDNKIYTYPKNIDFNKNEITTKIIQFQPNNYLKKVLVKIISGQVKDIKFIFHQKQNHNFIEEQSIFESSFEQCEVKEVSAGPGNQLNIFKMYFGHHVLTSFESYQNLLEPFQPQSIISTLKNKNQSYIYSYADLKKLSRLIPPSDLVQDQEFKSLYKQLREGISLIEQTKFQVCNTSQDLSYFIESLVSQFNDIISVIAPNLQKGAGHFRPKDYPREKLKLQGLYNELQQCDNKLKSIENKIDKLHELKEVTMKIKNKLQSLDQYNIQGNIFSNANNLTSQAEINYKNFIKENKKLQEKERIVKDLFENLKIAKMDCNNRLQDQRQQLANLSKCQNDFSQDCIDNVTNQKLQLSTIVGSEQITSLKANYDTSLAILEKEYTQKKIKIEARIEIERDKMNSDLTSQQKLGKQNKIRHFILIFDGSGSMESSWSIVKETYQKLIQPYKDDTSKNDIFSLITFDTKATIVEKRKKAQDLGDLPANNGGGTNFYEAFTLASQLVSITASDMDPVVVFMTDGYSSISDINISEKVLQSLFKEKPNGIFFAIGYGTYFEKDSLDLLSKAANAGKTQTSIGEDQYNLVLQAFTGSELMNIFTQLFDSFEASAQEAAIDALLRQQIIDTQVYERQVDFYQKQYQKKLEDIKKTEQFMDEINNLASQNKTESVNIQIISRRRDLEEIIISLQKELEQLSNENAKFEAELLNLQFEITRNDVKTKDAFSHFDRNMKRSQISIIQKEETISKIEDESGLNNEDGINKFHYCLSSVTATNQSLNYHVRTSKNLISGLRIKLEDLVFQFDEKRLKQLSKNLSDQIISEKVIESCGLKGNDLTNKATKDVIMLALENSTNNFAENKRLHEQLLNILDFSKIAVCKLSKIKGFAKQYAKKIQPKYKKTLKKRNKSLDSDSEDDSDDSGQNEDDSDETKVSSIDIVKDDESFKSLAPLYIDDIKIFLKDMKKKMVKIKIELKDTKKQCGEDNDQWKKEKKLILVRKKEIQYDEQYYQLLNDKELLIERLEKCLKDIYSIISKAVGKQITNRISQDFKIIYQWFKESIPNLQNPYTETTQFMLLENEKDIADVVGRLESDQQLLHEQHFKANFSNQQKYESQNLSIEQY